MTEYAKVAVVVVRSVGTTLVGDHPAGVTELNVYDRSEFSEDGGTLVIGDQTYEFMAWVGEAEEDALTLTTPTTADYEDGDRVLVTPAASETIATVVIDDEGEGIEVEVPHGLIGLLPEGVRDGDGETVILEDTDSGWMLTDIVKETPTFDGALIDPDSTIPPEAMTDGQAPGLSPAAVVAPFAVGAVEVSWERVVNADPVTYDVYASLTSPVTEADERVASTSGTSTVLSMLGGVQIPMGGAPVYVAIVARDADGSAALGAEASAAARPADNEYISALYAYLGKLEAGQIESGTLSAIISISTDGVINVGSRITIADANAPDGKGGITIWGDDAHTIVLCRLHPDGNYLDGILVAQEITVIQALRLIGELSAIASSAKLRIENGIADPPAPSITSGPILAPWAATPAGFLNRGYCWDATNSTWWNLIFNPTNKLAAIRKISPAGVVSGFKTLAVPSGGQLNVGGIAAADGSVYIVVAQADDEGPIWNPCRYNPSTGAVVTVGFGGYSDGAAISTDGTYIYVLLDSDDGVGSVVLRKTLTLGASGSAYIPASIGGGLRPPRGIAVGNFDRGTALIQAVSSTGLVRHFTGTFTSPAPSVTAAPSHDFTIPVGEYLMWNSTAGKFYSSSGAGNLSEWDGYYPAAGEKWWAQTVDTNGTAHTAASPQSVGVAVPARRYATVALAPAPAGVTGADVYVGYGTTSPGTTKRKRTESLSGRTMTLTAGKVTGTTAMPTTNTLGGSPGQIYDDFGNSWSGAGRLTVRDPQTPTDAANKRSIDAPENTIATLTPASGTPFTDSIQLRKVAGSVHVAGGFLRASGFSATFVAVGTIPVGFRPATSVTYNGAIFGSSITWTADFAPSGAVTVRMSAAAVAAMTVGGLSWAAA